MILVAVAAIMVIANVNAQDYAKNEISLGFGGGANTDIMSSFITTVFNGKQTDYWGTVNLEYMYRPSANLGVGAIAIVSGCDWDDGKDAKTTYITFMPAVKYNWLNKKHFSMYSKAAVGLTIAAHSMNSGNKTKVGFNFQASAVGLDFGKAFRGFCELGFGEQGIFVFGVRYKW